MKKEKWTSYMPNNVIGYINNKIPSNVKFVFIVTLMLGFLTHMYMLTNKFPNHDDLAALVFSQNMLTSGRWFLKYPMLPSSAYSLSFVCGTISLIFISGTTAIIAYIFNIKRKITLILLAAIIITFPTVAGTLMFMFTADGYFIAMFMVALASLLIIKMKHGIIPAIILIACATGIYQAYFPFAIAVLFLDILLQFVFSQQSMKALIIKGIRYILILLLSLAMYLLVLKLCLTLRGIELSNYSNINQMGSITIYSLAMNGVDAYKNFFLYFLTSYDHSFNLLAVTCNNIVILSLLYFMISSIIKWIKAGEKLRAMMIMLLIGLLPIAISSISLITPLGTKHSVLMIYPYVCVYIIVLKFVDYQMEYPSGIKASGVISTWIPLIACFIVSWNGYILANELYLQQQFAYQNSYSLANRIVTQIENLDNYSPNAPVLILGLDLPSENIRGNEIFEKRDIWKGTTNDYIFCVDSEMYNQNLFRVFCKQYLGVDLLYPNETQNSIASKYFEDMPSYPNDGSVDMKDGVVIIKF